jgi:hypothetical protein
MKIHEITEAAHVEINALMSLQNLVKRNGKNRNTFELIIVARFLQLLKDGKFWNEDNPAWSQSLSTNAELMHLLRTIDDTQLALIAAKVLMQVQNKGDYSAYAGASSSYVDWMNLYTAREATD